MVKKSFKITCETGIHARPATTLVNVVMGFKSDVTLCALKKEVDFKSIMGVMSLGIYSGTIIEVKAEGEVKKTRKPRPRIQNKEPTKMHSPKKRMLSGSGRLLSSLVRPSSSLVSDS